MADALEARDEHQGHQPSLGGGYQGGGHRAGRPGVCRRRGRNPASGVNAMALVLQESLRALFYAPYYAALALGAYEKEGLEVRFVSAPRPAAAPNALFHGTADVVWGGPMRANHTSEPRAAGDWVGFGEPANRSAFQA